MSVAASCRLVVICVLGVSVLGVTQPSPPDNRGQEFVLMFMQNEKYGTVTFPLELYVTTQSETDVTVHVTSPKSSSPSIDKTFTVHDGQVQKITLDGEFRMNGDGISTKGVVIQANGDVACYGANKESLSNDVFLGLPVDALGTDYYAVCQSPPMKKCEVGLASTQDNTQVKVTLPSNGGDVTFKGTTYHAGDTISTTLQQYETLQLQTTGDISGAHIVTSHPVASFSGNIKTNIGKGTTSDHLVEQLVPSDRWGKQFVTAPIPSRTVGDVFKVIAKEDGTTVTIPGMPTITLNKGEVKQFELPSNQYTSLSSDKPVMLAQFVKSQQNGSKPADPSMMIVPPYEQFGSDYTFSTPEYSRPDYGNSSIYRYQNEFLIVAKKTDVGGLLLDGKPFPVTTWHDIPGSQLVGAHVTLPKGAHTVRHSDPLSTFGGYLYGHAFRESYGFPTGMRLAPIYGNCTPTPTVPGDGIDNDCDNRIDEELCDNQNKDDDGDGKIDEDCVKTKPIDGLWSHWGRWSHGCSVTCGDGVQTKTRACDSPEPKFGGQNCTGDDTRTKPCYAGHPCPFDVAALCSANRHAVVANPLNCAQYYDCSKTSTLGQLHLFECPYPQLFSNVSLTCEDFETVTCDRRQEPMAPCEYLQNKCNGSDPSCLPCNQRHHSCVGDPDGKQAVQVLMPEYKECKKNRTMSEGKCDIGYFNPQAHKCIPHNMGTLSFFCRAHPGALTATPTNCAKFYNCSKSGHTLGDKVDECQYPDLFSTVTGQCTNFTTVDCPHTNRPEPQAPCEYDQYQCDPSNTTCSCPQVHADCRGQTDGTQSFPGRSWGPEYVDCTLNRTMSQKTCPQGQYFHPVQKKCTDKVTPGEVKDICTANPTLVFVDDQNCAKYYNCSDQNTLLGNYHAECQYPDLFSATNMRCQNFETVTCNKRMEPMAPCEYDQNKCAPGNTSCVPCDQRLPSCVGVSDGNQTYTGKSWKPEYMSCYKNRTMNTDKCTTGYFHPNLHQCTRDLAPPDAKPYCTANPSGIFPVKDNCAKFINCTAVTKGTVSDPVQECHYPDLFSMTTMKCQDFTTVNCDTRMEPQAPCEYDQNKCAPGNTSCVPCDQRLPSCVGVSDGNQTFTGKSWKPDYMSCYKNRTMNTDKCTTGYFHPNLHQCTRDLAPPDAKPYCTANPSGIFPVKDNCAKFINCTAVTKGTVSDPVQECHYPDLFSMTTMKCQDFTTVNCDTRMEPKAPCDYDQNKCKVANSSCIPCADRLPSCVNLTDGKQPFSGHLWKPDYVFCHGDRTILPTKKCSHGYFHPVTKQCEDVVNRTDAPDYCKANPADIIPIPDNCAKFINCSTLKSGLSDPMQECIYPDLFSTVTQICQDFQTVNCDTRMEPQAPCEYDQNICPSGNQTCKSCPTRLPSCIGKTNGAHAFTGRLWTDDYIECYENRTLAVKKCPTGTVFDPIAQGCVDTVPRNKMDSYCHANPTEIKPDPENCARYFNCSDNSSLYGHFLQECHYPDLFSTTLMACTSFETSDCQKRPEPKAPCEYLQNLCNATSSSIPCQPCPNRLPSCDGLPDGNYTFPGRLWKPDFITCYKNRTLNVSSCATGYFHPTLKQCTTSVKEPDAKSYCQGNPAAVLPLDDNCARSINCQEYTYGIISDPVQECKYPDLFSSVSLTCEDFKTVSCDKRMEPQAPCDYTKSMCDQSDPTCSKCPDKYPSCVGLADSDHAFPSQLWKSQYMTCDTNRTILPTKACPRGYFHPIEQVCKEKLTKNDSVPYCQSNPRQILPESTNCAKYYDCSRLQRGEPEALVECQYPDLFSTIAMTCQDFTTVSCDARPEPQAPCEYDQNLCQSVNVSCELCPRRLPSCVGLPNGAQVAAGYQWTEKYVECYKNRTMAVKHCPNGAVFDPNQLACVSNIRTVDISQFCKANPTAIKPHPTNCAQYYNCSNPAARLGSFVEECTYPDLFSMATMKCEQFEKVPCGARQEPQSPCEYLQNLCNSTSTGCLPCDQRLPTCVGMPGGDNPDPNHLWEAKFLNCYKNRTLDVKQCQTGFFHPIDRKCTTKVQKGDLPNYCSTHPTAIIVAEDNCAQYYNCSQTTDQIGPFVAECPYPALFSRMSMSCQSFRMTLCDTRQEPMAPCQYEMNLCLKTDPSCTPCPERRPSCVGLNDGPNPHPSQLWSGTYIICSMDRTMETRNCPAGQYFNPRFRHCRSQVDPVDIPDYCATHPNQMITNPDNCAQYFNCSSPSTQYKSECSYPDLYDPSTQTCDNFETVSCQTRPEPKAPCQYSQNICPPNASSCLPCSIRFPSCMGLSDGNQSIPSREWTADYVTCFKNRTIDTKQCQKGYFHPQLRDCVEKVQTKDIPAYCSVHNGTVLPNPDNCAQYINCSSNSAGVIVPQECPYPDLFSDITLTCQSFTTVTCDVRTEPQSPCEYVNNHCSPGNLTCEPCASRLPSCVGLKDGPHEFTGREWTPDYIECYKNRTVAEQKCPAASIFDPYQSACLSRINKNEIQSFCMYNAGSVKVNTDNCAQYFNCSQPTSLLGPFLMECTYPQLFSTSSMSCQDFKTVQCGNKKDPQAPCDYLRNLCSSGDPTCVPCNQRLPSCVGLPDGMNPIPGRLWLPDYVMCDKNRTVSTHQCQTGFFHPSLKTCEETVPKLDIANYCQAHPTDILPDPDSCARYFNCTDPSSILGMYQGECNYPDLFSPTLKSCLRFEQVNCQRRPVPLSPCEYIRNLCSPNDVTCKPCQLRWPSCAGKPDGNNPYPGALWSTDYVVCLNNRTNSTQTCQQGYFNPRTRQCQTGVPAVDILSYCQNHPTAVIPDPGSCAKYYVCSRVIHMNGQADECTYPDLFSAASLTCEPFQNVDCNQRHEPMAPCEYDANKCNLGDLSCIPCDSRMPSCIGLPDGLQTFGSQLWSPKFMGCSHNRTVNIGHCPPRSYFHPTQTKCTASIDTVDAHSFCQSNPTAVFQHPTNCAKYYDCTSATFGGTILKECPYPELFDTSALTCKNYSEVQCGARYEPKDPCEYMANQCTGNQTSCIPCRQRLPSCSQIADGAHPYPGSLWQQQYIICLGGRLQTVLRCPSNTLFNPTTLRCLDISRLQPPDYKDYCQAYPNAIIPDPYDCSRYFRCSTVNLYGIHTSQCTYPSLFSTVTKQCQYFDQVNCATRHEPTSACEYDHLKCNATATACVPCNIRFPDCTGQPDGDNGVTGMLWSVNYVICKGNRTMEVRRCLTGVFDPNSRRCSETVGPQHVNDLCQSNPTAIVPHPTNCAQYFDCSRNNSWFGHFLMECDYPLLFDSLTLRCRNFQDVQCGSKSVPKAPCDYFQNTCKASNTSCVPCTRRLVSCVGLPDGNNMVASQPWSTTYVVCDKERTIATLNCPSGYFHPTQRTCVDNIQPVDVPEFCRTNPHVVMVDTTNCASYINCTGPDPHFLHECPYPQLYSETSNSCQDFRSVYCGQRPEPQAPCEYVENKCEPSDLGCQPCDIRLPSCRGLPDGINGVNNQLWTDKYIVCDHNRTLTVQRCRLGIFDPASRSCRTSITPNNIQDVCSHNPSGRFSDGSDCARYFDCMARPVFQECHYPDLYSTDTQTCQDFRQVTCGSRLEPLAPCEYSQNLCPTNSTNCQPCPTRLPSCVRHPDGHNPFPGRLWTDTYMECLNNRTMKVARCPSGQIFDPVGRKCYKYVDPAHVPDFCTWNPTAVVASKNNSAQYFNCSDPSSKLGLPYLEECHYPDLFDPTLRQCRDFESVNPDSRPVPQAPCQYQQNLCLAGSPGCTPCPDRLYSCIDLPDGANPIEGKTWVPEYVNCYKNRTLSTGHCNQGGVFDPHKRACVVKDNGPLSIADQCSQDPTKMIPHTGSCSLFYNCSKNVATFGPILPVQLQECNYPDLFSPVYQRCMDFQAVKCNTRHEVKAPCEYLQNHCNPLDVTCSSCPERLPSCVGLPDGDNPIIGHYFTQDYIHCYKDRTLDRSKCSNGVFNPYQRECVDAIHPGDVDKFCSQNPTSVIASATDCAKYYDCATAPRRNGVVTSPDAASKECQYPDLYSTISHTCLSFTSVNCDQRPEPQAPCEYDQNQQCSPSAPACAPCEERLPSCVGLPDGLNGVTGAEYTETYVECYLNRTKDVKKCSQGFFDPGLKTCVTNINSGNIDEYCRSHPRAVVPHPINCAWYYDCSVKDRTSQSVYPFDVEKVQECRYPKLFSSATMTCEDFTRASCSKPYEPQTPCEYYKNRCDPTAGSCVPCPNRIPSCKTLTDGQHVINNLADAQRYLVECKSNRTMNYQPCSPTLAACQVGPVTTPAPWTLPTPPATTTQSLVPTVCAYNIGRVVSSPQHCGQYYNCSRNQPPFFFECTYPQMFSEITGHCQDFQSVSCHNRPEYKAPCDYQQNQCTGSDPTCTPCPQRLPSCEHLSDGNHSFPQDASKTRYFTCFLGRTVNVGSCLQGVFDVYLRRCAAIPVTNKPTVHPDTPQTYCKSHPTEVIAHPTNCAQFFDCHDIYTTSHIVKKECHYPLLFHPVLRTCSDFGSVDCGTKYEPQAPCDYYANQCHGGACIPCPDRFVSCVGQTNGNHPYPGQPASYVRCQNNRTVAVESCNSGATFDPMSGQCKTNTGSGDVIRDFCTINPYAVLTIPTNCAQYYKCLTENTQLGHYREECPYPQVFDGASNRCTDRTLAQCGQRPIPQTECDYELYSCLGFGCRRCNQPVTPVHTTHAPFFSQTPPTTTAAPPTGPSCVGKPDGLNPYPGRNLTSYYIVCDHGQFIEEGICIVDKILDPFRRRCTDPSDLAIIDVYCNANPGKLIPSVDNCAQYHTCGTSLSYHDNPLHECPYPQLFSTVDNVCKPFTDVQCGQKTEPLSPCDYTKNQCARGDFNCVPCDQRLPSCQGLPDGPNPNTLAPNTAKYVVCNNGRTVQQTQCLSGIFDPVTKACKQASATDPVTSFCTSNPNGMMSAPNNCAQYYTCATEQTPLGHYRQECPYPYLYDDYNRSCRSPSLVNCGSRTKPHTFCEYELYVCIGIDCMRCTGSSSAGRSVEFPSSRQMKHLPDGGAN